MRKRYVPPGRSVPGKKVWKWPVRDEIVLLEFERDWKGGKGFILNRRGIPVGRANPTWEDFQVRLLAEDTDVRALHDRDELVVQTVRGVMEDQGLNSRWARLIAYRVIDGLEDGGWL